MSSSGGTRTKWSCSKTWGSYVGIRGVVLEGSGEANFYFPQQKFGEQVADEYGMGFRKSVPLSVGTSSTRTKHQGTGPLSNWSSYCCGHQLRLGQTSPTL